MTRSLSPTHVPLGSVSRALALAPLPLLVACSGGGSTDDSPALREDGLHTMEVGGDERTYWLDLPTAYDPEDTAPLPLVLALHGTDGSHERWLDDTYNLKAAVGEDAVLIYPNALLSAAGTQQWVTDRDVPFIEALIDRLGDQVVFDPGRVLVTGQSSGAGMSHEVGCRLGDKVRAIAPQAGVLTTPECTGSVAVIQIQGTGDPVVPLGLATATNTFWSKYNGQDPDASEPTADEHCVSRAAEADHPYPVLWCTHGEGTGVARSDTTARFTLRFPESWPSTPVQGAVVAYAPGAVTPTTAPLAFLTMSFAPSDAVPGGTVEYEVPVSWTQFGSGGVTFPGRYTLMVTMHTEKGGHPIPVPEMDLWATVEHDFAAPDALVDIEEVLELAPISGDTGL